MSLCICVVFDVLLFVFACSLVRYVMSCLSMMCVIDMCCVFVWLWLCVCVVDEVVSNCVVFLFVIV